MKDLELRLMVADYDRTHALFSGKVNPKGISLRVFPPPIQGDACYKPVYELFDVAEMSLSWYVMARCRGEPLIALPIFPLRMFIQPYLFCAASSDIHGPEDLRGKRVGIQQYRLTLALWTRGILSEHHGVHASDIQWVTSQAEGAGYRVPGGIRITVQETDIETLLLEGKLDAAIFPNVPPSFRAGDARVRRVFGECGKSIQEYFQKTGIFPITHTVVTREQLVSEHPWIVKELVSAFTSADDHCRKRYEYPKRFSIPTAVLVLEEQERLFGKDPWMHGLSCNEIVLEKFVEYAKGQSYISFKPALNDLFASGKA